MSGVHTLAELVHKFPIPLTIALALALALLWVIRRSDRTIVFRIIRTLQWGRAVLCHNRLAFLLLFARDFEASFSLYVRITGPLEEGEIDRTCSVVDVPYPYRERPSLRQILFEDELESFMASHPRVYELELRIDARKESWSLEGPCEVHLSIGFNGNPDEFVSGPELERLAIRLGMRHAEHQWQPPMAFQPEFDLPFEPVFDPTAEDRDLFLGFCDHVSRLRQSKVRERRVEMKMESRQ